MIIRQSMFNALVFSTIVLAAVFFVVLGSKLVLSQCERDQNGECITVDRTADIASEIADLNQQLAMARSNAEDECNPPEISQEDWNSGNTAVLEGCWQLQYDYTMYYGGDSDRPNDLVDWGFCLEAAGGYALQDLFFEDGLQCTNQRLYYEFIDQQGSAQLRLADNNNLPCYRNGFQTANVTERELLCSLNASGDYAECQNRNRTPQGWNDWRDGIILRRRPQP
jgi:hypothetical protein